MRLDPVTRHSPRKIVAEGNRVQGKKGDGERLPFSVLKEERP